MSDGRYWLYFVVAFLGVIAVLTVAAGLQEWWQWRKEVRK